MVWPDINGLPSASTVLAVTKSETLISYLEMLTSLLYCFYSTVITRKLG
jgi:hypothetical protein